MKENVAEPVDPAFPTPEPVESVAKQTARGALWLAMASLGVQGLASISTIIVARFLQPADYGTVAMAMVVVSLAGVFVTFGFAPAIVSGRMKDPDAIATGHWLICLAGILLGGICFASAPIAAYFFKNNGVIPVLAAASAMLAINAWRVVPQATMQAANRYNVIALISVTGQFAASVSAIVLAMMHKGVWALIGPSLVVAIIGSIATLYFSDFKPRAIFKWRRVRPHAAEGTHILGNSITNYVFDSSDQVVVGKFLGSDQLGSYTFSFGLVSRSLDLFSRTISTPLLSSLGQLNGDPIRIDRAVVRTCVAIARMTFPVAAGGIVLAPLILRALAGPRWGHTAPLVRIFFVLGALQSVAQLSGPVWLALGRTRLVLWWGLISNTSVLGAFLFGAIYGGSARAVALSYTGYSLFVLAPLCIWATRKWCQISLTGLGVGLLRVLRDVIIMAMVVMLAGWVLNRSHVPAVISLLIQTAVGAATYIACFRLASTTEMIGMLSAMPRRVQGLAVRLLALPQFEAASA
jgi:O-antigen/teichoic acid export membrane protein